MLGNCEKMSTSTPPISSTTNIHQWPQNQKSFISSSSSPSSSNNKFMDHKSSQDPLKCPRCDSSNTKFCYYNNYSLSQPRHFCKACKRYWTRGGTLRNVPVGGGCRKNKRVKRPPPPPTSNGSDGITSAPVAGGGTANIKPSVQPEIDLSNNPFFYGLPTNPLELNFPFSRFGSTRVSSESSGMLDQINGLGLGFSIDWNDDYRNGFKEITSSSSSILAAAENSSILFGSSNFAPSSTMANLLVNGGLRDIQESSNFPGLMPYEDVLMGKEVKMEGQNGLEWNPNPTQIDQVNPSDSSSLLWNTTNSGAWFDPSNMGSSVPSLI